MTGRGLPGERGPDTVSAREAQLRAIVRAAVDRHLGRSSEPGPASVGSRSVGPSFARFPMADGGDGEGPCLIEPSVRCNRCGYCLSYGH